MKLRDHFAILLIAGLHAQSISGSDAAGPTPAALVQIGFFGAICCVAAAAINDRLRPTGPQQQQREK